MISKYLSLEECIKSPTAKRLGISNEPTEEHLESMKYVAVNVFDKVREHIGAPLAASSFYRSKELNEAVPGSSKTSQHMTGEAIDIDCDVYGNGSNLDVFNFIKDNLVFDQVILEYPELNGKPSWIHVSLVNHPKQNRGQVLVKLKTRYIPYGEYKVGMI
jgi:zinc D-Ala-D-Ala carboxypeptidase